jgi:hypothetical protein
MDFVVEGSDMETTENMLTVGAVAERLDEAERTIRNWIKRGVFAGARREGTPRGPYWVIPESALKDFVSPMAGRPSKRDADRKYPRKETLQASIERWARKGLRQLAAVPGSVYARWTYRGAEQGPLPDRPPGMMGGFGYIPKWKISFENERGAVGYIEIALEPGSSQAAAVVKQIKERIKDGLIPAR